MKRTKAEIPWNELPEVDRIFIQTFVANGFNVKDAYALTHPNVADFGANAYKYKKRLQTHIDDYLKSRYDELNICADHVLLQLADIAFSAKEDEIYNTAAKLKALDLMQKQMGLQTKNQNINADVKGAVTIIDDYGTESNTNQ